MSHDSPPPNDVQTPANLVASDASANQAPNPKRHFVSPEMLVADATLDDREKYDLLREWDRDLDQRLLAEDEGMSASDPIRSRFEAKLADEHARVRSALTDLALRLGDD